MAQIEIIWRGFNFETGLLFEGWSGLRKLWTKLRSTSSILLAIDWIESCWSLPSISRILASILLAKKEALMIQDFFFIFGKLVNFPCFLSSLAGIMTWNVS